MKRQKYKVVRYRGPIVKDKKLPEEDVISRAYNKYYDKINQTHPVSKEAFAKRIDWLRNNNEKYAGLSLADTVKKYMNTEVFTSAAERGHKNMLNTLQKMSSKYTPYKKNATMYTDFQKLGGSLDTMKWDNSLQGYTFRGKSDMLYLISLVNSPEDIFIRRIS